MILPSDNGGELVHGLLNDAGSGKVKRIAGFPRLEKNIRILGRTPKNGIIRRQPPHAMGAHQIVIDHGANIFERELLDLHDFMRSAESIEEVHEGNARLQSGRLGDQRKIHDFLDGIGNQHAPIRWTEPP